MKAKKQNLQFEVSEFSFVVIKSRQSAQVRFHQSAILLWVFKLKYPVFKNLYEQVTNNILF